MLSAQDHIINCWSQDFKLRKVLKSPLSIYFFPLDLKCTELITILSFKTYSHCSSIHGPLLLDSF